MTWGRMCMMLWENISAVDAETGYNQKKVDLKVLASFVQHT